MWQAITAGREWVGEFINRKKNGDIFYESARISAITNPDGKITHYLAVKEDITARKRAEEELRVAHDRLQAHLEEIQTLQANLREQAMRDPLTGLYNRRYLQEALERELVRAQREEYSVSVVMIDMDNLKNVNDTCGHDIGDLVLQSLAAVLTERTRASDILCRMGGDEFLLVMPGLSADDSYYWAERLRTQLFAIELPAALTRAKLRVTLSMGIAIFPEHGATSHHVILAADQAAYQAKAQGRDRAIIYQLPEQV
jgi:diguanylate cyclase (GGDEF)-like protein